MGIEEKDENEGDFRISENLWVLKTFLETAKQKTGKYYFIVLYSSDIGVYDVDFNEKTEYKISDDFLLLSDDSGRNYLIRLDHLLLFRKVDEENA